MDITYRKNLKDIAVACKNYTDTSIAQAKEEIYWHIGEYSVSTSDDNTTASSKTVPSNATRCKIKRIYGYTQKFSPSVASDDTSYSVKTMPSTVYNEDVSVVYGASEVSENLANPDNTNILNNTSNNYAIVIKITNLNLEYGKNYRLSFDVTGSTYSGSDRFRYYINNDDYYSYNGIDDAYSNGRKTLNIILKQNAQTLEIRFSNNAVSGNMSGVITNVMLNEGSSALPYEPYYTGIHNLELSGLKVEGANLFDKSIANINKALNVTNGYLFDSSEYMTSDYIAVIPNTQYSNNVSGIQFNICYYDKNKTFISGQTTATPYTIPSGAYYIRIQAYKTRLDTFMIVKGSTTPTTYEPYVSTTKTIDLSTILYNGNPLFEGNSLKAVNDVKDSITPYKATKKLGYVDLGSLDWSLDSYNNWLSSIGSISAKSTMSCLCAKYPTVSTPETVDYGCKISSTLKRIVIHDKDTLSMTPEQFKEYISGVIFIYELDTPIEVSIDWSSTLRGIQGYSNGTITLQNTYNMDTANTITYNSIIKENCCAKMVQTRGGSVIKTINFPTQASDGYSAGSSYNVRDLTTSKRGTNVSKESNLGSLTWNYNSTYKYYLLSNNSYIDIKLMSNEYTVNNNLLANNYTNRTQSACASGNNDMSIGGLTWGGGLIINDFRYTNATTFKTAMANEPLYYELADASKIETSIDSVENIIEVEPNDVLTFYDSNDNLVTIPSDLTYRIEVAN